MEKNLALNIEHLSVSFETNGISERVVSDVSLSAERGKITVLLGESGCGKSVTASCITNLLDANGTITAGKIMVDGKDVLGMTPGELCKFRGKNVGMIFQNAADALNPLMTVGALVTEAITAHRRISRKDAREQAVSILRRMRLNDPEELMKRYPFELSGGMCQRVMIAMAMAMQPALLIADEPTTALDVTVQASILAEICEMAERFQTGVLFITHDLGIVAEIADYVYVMRGGRIIEQGSATRIFKSPEDAYTKQLIDSII